MMTQEEVAQVIAYCEENKVSYKQRLDELGIAAWMFYDAKRKYVEIKCTSRLLSDAYVGAKARNGRSGEVSQGSTTINN